MVLVLPAREGYDRWAEVYEDDGNPLLPLEEEQVARLLGDVRGGVGTKSRSRSERVRRTGNYDGDRAGHRPNGLHFVLPLRVSQHARRITIAGRCRFAGQIRVSIRSSVLGATHCVARSCRCPKEKRACAVPGTVN
jgi:hypothetical protein